MTRSWKLSHIISLGFIAAILMLGVAGGMASDEGLMSTDVGAVTSNNS